MDYRSKNHSKYLIMYHIIFVCKYRKKLLITLGDEIKNIIFDIQKKYSDEFEIIEMEVDKDHIHILIETNPKTNLLKLIKNLKQITTYRIWRQNNNHLLLSKYFWLEKTFWSDGYFCCTIDNVSKSIIEKYIQNQG